MTAKKITEEQKKMGEEQIYAFQNKIDYDTKDFTLELLINKFDNGEFFIPEYQRQYVWKEKNRSLFIESVLLGLPIPFMFFADCEDGRLEIIDGAQRIQTLHRFLNDDFKLSSLQKLTALNGFKYSDLSSTQQRRLKNRTFRIIVLDEKTTLDVRQDLFNRINTTGIKASDSEVRRGSYPGKFTKFIEKCCKNSKFIKLCPLPESKTNRHERFELVLRFFAYLNNYKGFVHSVNTFLDNYLIQNLNKFDEKSFDKEFNDMLDFVERNFPNGFAKTNGANSTPRVRFEAIAVGTALALREDKDLIVCNVDWIDSDKFKELTTSDASNNQKKLVDRIEYVRDELLKGKI